MDSFIVDTVETTADDYSLFRLRELTNYIEDCTSNPGIDGIQLAVVLQAQADTIFRKYIKSDQEIKQYKREIEDEVIKAYNKFLLPTNQENENG